MDKKTRVLHVRFTEAEYENLARHAEKERSGLSEYIRALLFEALDKEQPKKRK